LPSARETFTTKSGDSSSPRKYHLGVQSQNLPDTIPKLPVCNPLASSIFPRLLGAESSPISFSTTRELLVCHRQGSSRQHVSPVFSNQTRVSPELASQDSKQWVSRSSTPGDGLAQDGRFRVLVARHLLFDSSYHLWEFLKPIAERRSLSQSTRP